jgi:hypothetical protein
MPSIAEMREFCRTYVNPSYKDQQKQIAFEKPLISDQDRAKMLEKLSKLSQHLGSLN